MFNLLPEQEKKEILTEYRIRRLIIASIFLLVLGFIAVISLLPSYLLSSAKVVEGKDSVAAIERSSIVAEEPALQSSLQVANVKLSALTPASANSLASVLDAIGAARSEHIRLNGILFTRGAPGAGVATDTIQLSGVAKDRDSLSAFEDALKANPLFTSVDLPVSNFAKDQNEDFSLSLTGSF